MRIHHQPFVFTEPGPEHNVGGLAGDARQGKQLVHFLRNLAAEVADNLLGCTNDRLRLVSKESCGTDIGLKLFRI